MAGFIGFIIVMAVLGNIIDGLSSHEVQMYLSAIIAVLGAYRFTKRNLAQWLKLKDRKKLEDQKEKLRQEIEAEKEKIEAIQEIQPDTVDEPY